MNRQQFLEYADHFNNHRWGKVVSYFCPEVTVEYPDNFMGPQKPGVTGNTLHGPQAFPLNRLTHCRLLTADCSYLHLSIWID